METVVLKILVFGSLYTFKKYGGLRGAFFIWVTLKFIALEIKTEKLKICFSSLIITKLFYMNISNVFLWKVTIFSKKQKSEKNGIILHFSKIWLVKKAASPQKTYSLLSTGTLLCS